MLWRTSNKTMLNWCGQNYCYMNWLDMNLFKYQLRFVREPAHPEQRVINVKAPERPLLWLSRQKHIHKHAHVYKNQYISPPVCLRGLVDILKLLVVKIHIGWKKELASVPHDPRSLRACTPWCCWHESTQAHTPEQRWLQCHQQGLLCCFPHTGD